jgi:hypothetical protein
MERKASVLERLPPEFEQQPVLRIEQNRFARRNAEEVGIEEVQVFQEPAAPGDGAAQLPRFGVVKAIQ